MMRKVLICLSIAALTGCAQRAALKPAAGESLPIAPYGAKATPDADDLLEPSAQAIPSRNVELLRRSEEREDDPFDLPPE